MGKTSNKSKQDWNASRYSQLKISIAPELASSFKETCADENVSMASKLSEFIADYCKSGTKPRPSNNFITRPKRRAAVSEIIKKLELIKDEEEDYLNKIPENLQNSIAYEKAELTVSALEETLELLASAY